MLEVYERAYQALRCHVQNISNGSALRQAVMSHCYRLVLQLNFIVTVELLYDQAESDFVSVLLQLIETNP